MPCMARKMKATETSCLSTVTILGQSDLGLYDPKNHWSLL